MVPPKFFATPNIVTAAILYVLHGDKMPYACCRYDGFLDRYQFLFRDDKERGPSLTASLNERQNDLVPAARFRKALFHLHADFRREQQANGNRNGGAL